MHTSMTAFALAVVGLACACLSGTVAAQSTDPKSVAIAAMQAAIDAPTDVAAFKRYADTLPKDGSYFVVEGDYLKTEDELREYVFNKHFEKKRYETMARAGGLDASTIQKREIIVDAINGVPNYRRDQASRTLTFAVSRIGFSPEDHALVVENMRKATADWVNACPDCGVSFTYRPEFDESPSHANVTFIVRLHDVNGQYIATAFFPNEAPDRRYVNIDPSYFKTRYDKVGVLRHELGHVLGYHHEHIRGVTGCASSSVGCVPLTDYDRSSVMHYYCGGGGTLDLSLTDSDRAGHRKLYGPSTQKGTSGGPGVPSPLTPPAPPKTALTLRFEGGDVSDNIAAVLLELAELKTLPTASHSVGPGESLARIITERLNLPGYSRSMNNLATAINGKDFDSERLQVGDQVLYPDVEVTNYQFSHRLDPTVRYQAAELAQIERNWKFLEPVTTPQKDGTSRVQLRGYQIKISFESRAELDRAAAALRSLERPNVLLFVPPTDEAIDYHAASEQPQPLLSGAEYWSSARSVPGVTRGTEGYLGSYIGIRDVPTGLDVWFAGAPGIVLFDKPVGAHPDIAPALIGPDESVGVAPAANEPHDGDVQDIREVEWEERYHGSHLAGIIACQRNGFGLVGVYPGIRIAAQDWDALHLVLPEAADIIETFEGSGVQNIYLLASEWRSTTPLNNSKDRFRDVLAAQIKAARPMFVIAAGQSTGGPPVDVRTIRGPWGPNLGDLASVIVATVCVDCYGENPRLWDSANYSLDEVPLVHVAAPGLEIPSATSVGADYAEASGTSQATAFVAAVVASMVALYPNYNWKSWQIKERILVTSRPTIAADENNRIAAGVLDPSVAFLDPCKDWIDLTGPGGLVEARSVTWATAQLTAVNPTTRRPVALGRTMELLRLFRRADGTWMLYTREKIDPSDADLLDAAGTSRIRKIGPVILLDTDKPILRCLVGGVLTTLSLDAFDDLVLSKPVIRVVIP